MLGFRFIKAPPTHHLIAYRKGIVRREGAGLAFWYFAPYTTLRYQITSGAKSETQSSSGIIVSTGLGSTGWLKSIRHGAAAIAGQPDRPGPPPWDTKQLIFSVREPFPSRSTQAGIVTGRASDKRPLVITSAMAEHGVIFSDGMEGDFLAFNSGVTATITPLPGVGHLVVKPPTKAGAAHQSTRGVAQAASFRLSHFA